MIRVEGNLRDANLLAAGLKQVGVRLFNEDGSIRDFMVVMDDLLLKCNFNEFHDIMNFMISNDDLIFGGLTDERDR